MGNKKPPAGKQTGWKHRNTKHKPYCRILQNRSNTGAHGYDRRTENKMETAGARCGFLEPALADSGHGVPPSFVFLIVYHKRTEKSTANTNEKPPPRGDGL